MKAARFTPPLLIAGTLVLLGANAIPSMQRKRVLVDEVHRLERALEAEQERGERLTAEIDALANDPFYLERCCLETWRGTPRGAIPFDPDGDDEQQDPAE